ncbi:MAG: TVP38/TMEM64 family protein [Nitrospirae bacterium]|nr:TVP38/TMEM64 family protein [Nitrospirota bacterium]
MKYRKRLIIFLLFLLILLAMWFSGAHEYITFDKLKENREMLKHFVDKHYYISVLVFIVFYILTAFFIPGAIVSTVAGGFLFGVVMGTIYVNIGSVSGATFSFLLSRYLIGNQIQHKYSEQLKKFNKEIERHGHNYLFVIRITPIVPFFLTNYLAGLTKISLKKFIMTTSLGMLPGSIVYTFAGQQLAEINNLEELYSFELLIALSLLALFALLPVIRDFMNWLKRKTH